MSTPPSSGRKRTGRSHNVEDETLSQIAKEVLRLLLLHIAFLAVLFCLGT